ncbi:E3 ubiquitin-protein ligase znrf2 [Dermatophagoides farinae]|uniref:E3 ubiquitin-protein ligase ZNRF1 n=2 Tax=Dermatophagoides farinae TaxID=6954 RepID=A0A922IDT1_DERFA|nr:E3 ubiquitin-protein ligase ZNRF1-like [Dermatophagoides farinae]KAH9529666.1 E3 ubiquitin-protein ligase znrf2 [Dermatophagoides farinae]
MMGARQSTTSTSSNSNSNGSPSRMIHHQQQHHNHSITDEDNSSNMGNYNSTYSTSYRNNNSHRSNNENNQIFNNNNNNDNNSRQRTRSLVLSGDLTTSGSSSSRPSHSSAIDFTSTTSSSHDILPNDLDVDIGFSSMTFMPFSLPIIPYNYNHVKCSGCSKVILKDELQFHLMCYKLPFNYNEDVLTEDKGECVICLEDMLNGDKIARLPCLCIYHKKCIDAWFNVNRSCPEHPTISV